MKWVIYVLLAFLGNGMCSVVQKMQQVAFDGNYKNEFMIVALAMVSFGLGAISLFTEKNLKENFRNGWHLALFGGLLNGMVNLFVMILSARMPVSVMFPLVSAGGIVVTYLLSKLCYKEQLTRKQFWGFILGIGAVILLNM